MEGMDAWTAVAGAAMGYFVQWLRAFERIPNAVGHVIIVVAAITLFLMGCNCHPVWGPAFFLPLFTFVLSLRGAAAYAKDMKAAPKTDSL